MFWGIWGKAELILRIWGAKAKHYREHGNFLSGICGDQYIIFREQVVQALISAQALVFDLAQLTCQKRFDCRNAILWSSAIILGTSYC